MEYTPKQTKYIKAFKGRLLNNSPKTLKLSDIYNDSITLISKDSGRLLPAHLTCIRNTVKKNIGKNTYLCAQVFPHIPVTSKPLEVRMGKGKGSVEFWAANVFSGTSFMKIYTPKSKAFATVDVLTGLKKKLPLNITIIHRK